MRARGVSSQKGIIAWFAENHVAANLMMLFIVVAGLISLTTIRKQSTPDFQLNTVRVQMAYLGAAPQEVEEGVIIKIEEAVQDIKGIVEIRSSASENFGTVTVEVAAGSDINEVLGEVKTRVDAISTFPGLTEKPVIYKQEFPIHVVFVAIYGDLDDFSRKSIAQDVRDELMTLPDVNQVQFLGNRAYEISIEVSEHILRQYGLTMTEISQAVRSSSVDLPGGTINTSGGDILLRTEGQLYTGSEYDQLVLRTYPDGTRLTLGDIATIKDGFVESHDFGRFNGEPTATLRVLASGQQNELKTAAAVRKYVEEKSSRLPGGVKITTWIDRSQQLHGRLNMMMKNMSQGALLVFLVLSLFLRMKVAGWVIVGIPITFLGALWLMPFGPWPVTINMISLFGFIIVLGIVVDDAIIIGESVYTKIRAEGHTIDNVVLGAKTVAMPATFGVLTTIAAFAPMLFVGGIVGPFFEAMSMVVILCLLFSLVESKLILPAHLVQARIKPVDEDDLFHPQREIGFFETISRFFQKIQRYTQHGLQRIINDYYRPLLAQSVDNRGVTVMIFVAMLVLTAGLLQSGFVRIVLFPEVSGNFIQMNLQMQNGTAPDVRNAALDKIEAAIFELNEEYIRNNPDLDPIVSHVGTFTNGDTAATCFVEIPFVEGRALNRDDVLKLWRDRIGEIAGVKDMTFGGGEKLGGGVPLSFRLSGNDYVALERAASELEIKLAEFNGVFDIRNSSVPGGQEIRLAIKPEAEALGLTMTSLGRQVRQAFYGEEAQRIQRGRDELRVMIRYPREDRRSIADLENMRIRTPAGVEVPFQSVADISFGQSYSTITRLDRARTITVSSDLDTEIAEPGKIIKSITDDYIPELLSRYPGVRYGLEGSSQEEQDFIRNISVASIAALFLIYTLIAIPLHSYGQPLVIMSVIPFGLIGAVLGHIIMGKALSIFSLFGLIALAGVVVNDSLILVDFVNHSRLAGVPLRRAIIDSGTKRFRAIILTSFTTSAGLLPILLEKSVQAQFVIPMAISVGFGIIFATVITLFLVPALLMLQVDFLARTRYLWDLLLGRPEAPEQS